jgi:hypothetical protein
MIPLVVETYSSLTETWSATTSYQVQCVPVASEPASGGWASPTTAGADTGYLVTGLTLDPDQNGGDFYGYVKLSNAPLAQVEPAFTLKLT